MSTRTRCHCSDPHECPICQKRFVSKQWTSVHIETVHEGKKSYKCDMCSATFGSSSGLSIHKVITWEKQILL